MPDPLRDARPGSQVPLFVPDGAGGFRVATLEWGFPLNGRPHAVFNTRIESALEQLRRGRRGMWAKAIAEGRCLVPVRAFYESHATEKAISEKTGKPVRRQCRFRLPGARAFLLAAVQQDSRFSIVTTKPNASVIPVHDRMPLVLGSGESTVWFGPDFATLANRSAITLAFEPER
ncbi:SOS response-associated peptidase family protein [Collinsella intestinalis]|uniref:SOS response-associated peptidase family protein n=1 Tax=Collinsella intestinalis TaxID=147207 RepID=UPI00315CCE4B